MPENVDYFLVATFPIVHFSSASLFKNDSDFSTKKWQYFTNCHAQNVVTHTTSVVGRLQYNHNESKYLSDKMKQNLSNYVLSFEQYEEWCHGMNHRWRCAVVFILARSTFWGTFFFITFGLLMKEMKFLPTHLKEPNFNNESSYILRSWNLSRLKVKITSSWKFMLSVIKWTTQPTS